MPQVCITKKEAAVFRYVRLMKRFFSFGSTKKSLLFHLYFSAVLRVSIFLALPFIASEIINFATDGDFHGAFIMVGAFAGGAVLYIVCYHYNYWAYAKNANYIHNDLQQKVLAKISTLPANFSEDIPRAAIINTAFRDINECRTLPDYFFDCLNCFTAIIISAVILFTVDLNIGLISLGCILVSGALFLFHMKRRDYYGGLEREQQDAVADLYSQTLDGHKEIHAFDMKSNLNEYFEHTVGLWRRANLRKRLHHDIANSAVPVILGLGRIIIYLLSAYLILKGEANIAILVLVVGYYDDMLDNYDSATDTIYNLSKNMIAVNRMHRFLNFKTEQMQDYGTDATDDIEGHVEFKNVSFTYDGKNSVKNLNFAIEPNTFTAIVGKSGSGKSTIFRLLLRLYQPPKGQILIDCKHAEDYTKDVYSTNVSIVTQKPFVFDMTIRQNLDLVDSNHEHQIEACKVVGIHDDIMRLERGYDTPLINDGANLSAGQKQLLSLARTLLSKSEILLFDEVTSSLNDRATAEIIKVLQKLSKNHTVLVITHKPDLMRLADDVLVIDKGRLVARGSHKTLLKKSAVYKTLQV